MAPNPYGLYTHRLAFILDALLISHILKFMNIPGFPYRKLIIDSQLETSSFELMLRSCSVPKAPILKRISNNVSFVGKITTNSFRIMPKIKGRNSYNPWIIGSYQPKTNGCQIKMTIMIHPLVIIVMLFFFIFPQYLTISKGGSFNVIFFIVILIFHFIMYFLGYLPEAKKIEKLFIEATK